MSPDAEHQQALADMGKQSGKAFYPVYMKSQLTDHQAAVDLFTQETANGIDPSAKADAAKYLPKFKMHL